MLEKLKSPAVIISAIAFVAMVVVFIAHYQLTGDQVASFEPTPVVKAPVEVASVTHEPGGQTPAPAETPTVTPPAPEPPREVTYAEAEAAGRAAETAHAEAETDVSPMVSGILLKAGLFGLFVLLIQMGRQQLYGVDLTHLFTTGGLLAVVLSFCSPPL